MLAKILFLILGSWGVAFSLVSRADDYQFSATSATIRPMERVNESIWRSGRPKLDNLKQAYADGVRVIVDLENKQDVVDQEAQDARRIGFKFYSFPMSAMTGPTDAQVDQILSMLKNPSEPVLVHCHHGEDRTGLIIGLERVFIEGWTPQAAYDEMQEKGFHRQLAALDRYFKKKTHF